VSAAAVRLAGVPVVPRAGRATHWLGPIVAVAFLSLAPRSSSHAQQRPDELAYFMTLVNQTKAKLNAAQFSRVMEKSLRAGACQNPNYVKFFKAGVTLVMVYTTRDGAEVARVRLPPSLCKT